MDNNLKTALITILMDMMNSSESSDESTSDSDLEVEEIIRKCCKIPRMPITNYFEEVVQSYSSEEFLRHFRISRTLFVQLAHEYEQTEEYQKLLCRNPNRILRADKSFAIFLWFAAHKGCAFRDIQDRFNVSLSRVHSSIIRWVVFISNLSSKVIRWPTTAEMKEEARLRQSQCGISGIIGCIDGDRIVIDPPAQNKNDYIDRKGDTTLVVQAVCNKKKKFIDVFIGYPGSVHDSIVFRNSPLYNKLCELPAGHYLLGDSAYPCLMQLMPPYIDNGHLTAAQRRFNNILSSQRIDIEYTFGILKQRFQQLFYCKLRGIKLLCHFIRACMVLHNLCDLDDIGSTYAEVDDTNNDDQPVDEVESCLKSGNLMRDAICELLSEHIQN